VRGGKGGTFHPYGVPEQLQIAEIMRGSPDIKMVLGQGQGGTFHCSTPSTLALLPACNHCGEAILERRWLGLWITLEPLALDDHGEYLAIRDGVRTWNVWPDKVTEPRGLEQVRYRELTARHAGHRCGASYGTVRPPIAIPPAPLPDEPPF